MLELNWTPRFEQKLNRYNGIQDFVANKTGELIRKYKADPVNWTYDLEKLKDKSFGLVKAYRIPITSRDRLVFVVEDKQLILVDIGDHDVMDEYSRMPKVARESDISKAKEPESWFSKAVLQSMSSSKGRKISKELDLSDVLNEEYVSSDLRWKYDEELDETWIQFLDDPQAEIVEDILKNLATNDEDFSVYFVMGGPGTGKTVVLLNLLFRLTDLGRSVSLEVNDQVAKYLGRGNRPPHGINLGFGPGVTVLLDDPTSIDELSDALRRAKASKCRALIVGFDPLQWHERKMEEKFSKICENTRYQLFGLWVCYRQSFGVAKKTLELTSRIYGESSRFLDLAKIKSEKEEMQQYLDLTLGMEFVDESGRSRVILNDLEAELSSEVQRLKSRIDLWKHTHSICIVYEDEIAKEWRQIVKNVFKGLNKLEITLARYRDIRGVEFQEVYLFVSQSFWNKLNIGQQGLNSKNWEKLTSLHTVLSRPKDSLIILVAPDSDS